jgi:hypothetical protein
MDRLLDLSLGYGSTLEEAEKQVHDDFMRRYSSV